MIDPWQFFLLKILLVCVFTRLLAEKQLIFKYMFVALSMSRDNQSDIET